MDASALNPFLDAALRLFKDTFHIQAEPGQAYLVKDQINHRWEISGVLGVTGQHQGIVSFRLPRLLADKLLERSGVTTGSEKERRDMVNGMVAELTNIIAGNASNAFPDGDLDISPPIVVMGDNHEISWPRIAPVIGIPFRTPHGPFEVDICLQ